MTTSFFTGNGDSGSCSIGGQKVGKNAPIMQLLGALDECNSQIGLAVVTSKTKDISESLLQLQQDLFVLQAEVAGIAFDLPSKVLITNKHTVALENSIQTFDNKIPKIDYFVLPGGTVLAAQCDMARAVSRRVERLASEFAKQLKISNEIMKYLNRISSMLFVLARYANVVEEIEEVKPRY